jgi:hypothetical protein
MITGIEARKYAYCVAYITVINLDLELLKLVYILIPCLISVRDICGVENMSLVAEMSRRTFPFISMSLSNVRSTKKSVQ